MMAARFVNEFDDELGQVIGGRRLAGRRRTCVEAVRAWDSRAGGGRARPTAQRVKQLPLVFVDALDLAIEDVSGSTACPVVVFSQSANFTLAWRLALRKES